MESIVGRKAMFDVRPEAPNPSRRRSSGLRLSPLGLSRYVLGQLLGPVALLTVLLVSVIWLVNILPLLDLVINRGQ